MADRCRPSRRVVEVHYPGAHRGASQTHPADTITPYRRLVDLYLAETGNKYRYQYAVRHVKALRTIHREQGTEAEFTAYLTALRDEHRRKTSLLTQLDQADLT
ncbi:hypothetical protein ABZ904_15950 [Streptomyces sp. NPDC046900]|uniref:hypothetical protein n=1 Tax=Streptomyces sp. NPDC046900 TaxID=3155473 RepID=UPI003411A7D4